MYHEALNQSPVTSESSQCRVGRWTRAIPSQSRITNMSNKHQLSPTSVFPGNFAKKHLLSGRRNNSDYCELEECIDDVLTPVHELERAKSRSRIAFKRVTDKYKALLRQKQRQIDEMREISDGTAPGGSMYMDLQRAYEASQSDIRKLQLKVKSLVKMLDRAGATIRLSAEERREASSWVDTDKSNLGTVNEDAAEENVFSSRIDWSPVKEVMKDVIVYGRTDNQILNEIVLYIQKLNYQIADPEQYKSSTRLTTAKVDAEKETLFKTVEQQRKEIASLTEALAQAL